MLNYKIWKYSEESFMVEFVPFDLNIHMEEFRQMNIETIQWQTNELMERYQVDMMSFAHQTTVTEWVDDNLEPYLNLIPPEGIVLILEVDGNVAGMIALWSVNDELGEIGRMWIRPKFRGKGYSMSLLNKTRARKNHIFTTFTNQ